MAKAGMLYKDVSEQLSCAVCLEKYKKPKVLGCLHSFCKDCLVPLVKNNTLLCPKCRKPVELGTSGVDGLKDNFFINSLLDVMGEHADCGELKCSLCDEEDDSKAVSVCEECAEYLCTLHDQSHRKSKGTKAHVLCSLENFKGKALKQGKEKFCSKHDDEILKLFCETCEQLICRDCIIIDHNGHEYMFVKDAKEKHVIQIQEQLDKTQNVAKHLNAVLNSVTRRMIAVESAGRLTTVEINNLMDKNIQLVEKQRRRLLQQVETYVAQEIKDLLESHKKFIMDTQTLDNCISFTKTVLDSKNHAEILAMKKQIIDRLLELKEEGAKQLVPVNVSLQLFDKCTIQDSTILGRVSTTCMEKCQMTLAGPSVSFVGGNTESLNLKITTCDDQGKECINIGDVIELKTANGTSVDKNTIKDKCFLNFKLSIVKPTPTQMLFAQQGIFNPSSGIFQWGQTIIVCINNDKRSLLLKRK